MSSRDDMLRAVRAAKPALVPLPEIPAFTGPEGERTTRFVAMVEAVGGAARVVPRTEIGRAVRQAYPDAAAVASTVPEVESTLALDDVAEPHDLAGLDLLVCEGTLGVAENGAVWLREGLMGRRAAPFLTQHLVLVLAQETLVATMHDAYRRLDVGAEGFGVFVAGPSKTADIEQSLVIGAHGPRSLLVLLV